MRARGIQSLADLRAIESRPYAEFEPHANVMAALEASAAARPGKPALSYIVSADPAVPPRVWTYAAMMEAVRRAARAFRQLAGQDQPRVAFLLPAIPQAYFTLWGAEAVGVACPINYLLGQEHVAGLINATGANIVVALGPDAELDIWSRVPGLRERCPGLRHVVAVGGAPGALDFDELLAAQPALPPDGAERGPGDLAALFHTGGTTGRPKLVRHTQRNQLHAARGAARMYGAGEDDVILNGFPLFHVAGSFVYGLSILLAGGEVVLPTLLGLRNTDFVRGYWTFVERHRVTLLAAVPTVMSSLLGVDRAAADLASVRCLLTGGSPLPAELAETFERKFGVDVRNILGMTECCGVIAVEPAGMPRVAGSAGLPLPFMEVRVVDDAGGPLPAGRDGLLQIRGPNVSPGYVDAAHDADVMLAGGWMATGDIGHLDQDGRVYVTGRAKDLIIRSSHNIDPVVIEDALLQCPDVLMAAAVGAPDEYAGEVPVGYVSLRPGAVLDAEAVAAQARRHIPERPAYPKQVFILDALPVTAIGKLYKPPLREMAVRWVIDDRIARDGLAGRVAVDVRTEGRNPVVCLMADGGADLEARLRRIMAPFALAYRIERGAS